MWNEIYILPTHTVANVLQIVKYSEVLLSFYTWLIKLNVSTLEKKVHLFVNEEKYLMKNSRKLQSNFQQFYIWKSIRTFVLWIWQYVVFVLRRCNFPLHFSAVTNWIQFSKKLYHNFLERINTRLLLLLLNYFTHWIHWNKSTNT